MLRWVILLLCLYTSSVSAAKSVLLFYSIIPHWNCSYFEFSTPTLSVSPFFLILNFHYCSVSSSSFSFSLISSLSVGLMADAANSAGDLLIDAVVFYTIKEASKKATPERPWGRGKIEPLGALTIGGVLLATGGGN